MAPKRKDTIAVARAFGYYSGSVATGTQFFDNADRDPDVGIYNNTQLRTIASHTNRICFYLAAALPHHQETLKRTLLMKPSSPKARESCLNGC